MIQTRTMLTVADNSGARKLQCIKVLGGTKRRYAQVGDLIIVAVKEASANINQISDVVRLCGHKLAILSGDDSMTLPLLAVGGKGIISVLANIVPKEVKEVCNLFFKGDLKGAIAMHQRLLPLGQAMFVETNPIPVKEAMILLGKKAGQPRLPLTPLSAKGRERLIAEMRAFGFKI